MTAARVLNPMVMDFCKIHASPTTVGRNLPCGRQLNRIKRDLFGPANPNEINKVFVEELEKHQEKAINKWGFDFRAGKPLNINSQYIWERISFPESNYTPEIYTLTRTAHLRPTPTEPTSMDLLMDERANRENSSLNSSSSICTDTDSCDDSIIGVNTSVSSNKRQPKITEYMKERKRLAQIPKKIHPIKRTRTTSGGINANSNSPSRSTHNTLSSHFALRGVQRHK